MTEPQNPHDLTPEERRGAFWLGVLAFLLALPWVVAGACWWACLAWKTVFAW